MKRQINKILRNQTDIFYKRNLTKHTSEAVLSLVDSFIRSLFRVVIFFYSFVRGSMKCACESVQYLKRLQFRYFAYTLLSTGLCVFVMCSVAVDASWLDAIGAKHSRVLAKYLSTGTLTKEHIGVLVKQASEEHGVEPKLIWSVIQIESNFDPLARSTDGAIGLMQLMPETAKYLEVNNPWDAYENISGGTKYLRYLLERFDGDVSLALAAYNAGPGSVAKYKGIPPYPETTAFVRRVMLLYQGDKPKQSSPKIDNSSPSNLLEL